MDKRLYRSSSNKMVSGVLGGIAEYFNFDATILRLIFVVALPFTAFFPLFFVYIAAAFIMPIDGEV
ncbi:putative membrane protein YvlC [Paraliobacillus quinghaiensis]|uniref:Membrane protein YvlC n=1 Tax=Paraliobacillus quinghaiensis TaxID=470815 RepID=A0A917TT69_9BACI|nr:PspC domain-containing protein [Paraliobacillus quinghaiensis]GGM36351.1 putative membrane protein YvlC [Paraliobacillus quinghaiensis]